MKNFVKSLIILGFISIILGIISRLTMQIIIVQAEAYLQFSQFCYLVAITFILYKMGFKDEEE